MKKTTLFLLSLFIICFTYTSKAQLSGVYTIGGVAPDYPSLNSAINSLTTNGVNAPVIFNIRNGIYHGLNYIDTIAGASLLNTITFQSESGDSSLVIITADTTEGTFSINNSDNLIFRKITAINTNSSSARVFYIKNSNNISIENCRLACPNDNNTTDIDGSTIYLDNYQDTTIKTSIKNSYILSNKKLGIYVRGGDYDSLIVEDNIIDANINIESYIHLTRNRFLKKLINFASYDGVFLSNIFEKGGDFSYASNVKFESNICHGTSYFVYADSSFFYNNSFDTLNISYSTGLIFKKNIVKGPSTLLYNDYFTFEGNRVFNECWFSYNHNSMIINNVVHHDFWINFSDNSKILCNNFSKNSALKVSTTCQILPEIKFNNFYNLIPFGYYYDVYQNVVVDSNNYYPAINTTELHPFHINPLYDDTVHLQATNILLAGKVNSSTIIPFDIEGVSRNYPTTIGANEICISTLNGDTINLSCGEILQLNLCNHDESAVYVWSPSYQINDSTISNPIVSPDIDTTYRVDVFINSNLVYSDSVRITINKMPIALATFQMNQPSVQFINNSRCATDYNWNFGDGTSSTEFEPVHQYDSNGVYYVSLISTNNSGSDTITFPIYIDYYLGIDKIVFGNYCHIFPNPCNDKLSIVMNQESITKNNVISIYNIQGKLFLTQSVYSETADIDLSTFPKGVYILKLNSDNNSEIKRFIKH